MTIRLVPLLLFAVSYGFFVLAVDPKSKWAFVAAMFAIGALLAVFWPELHEFRTARAD